MLQDTARPMPGPLAGKSAIEGRRGDDLVVVPGRHVGRWVAAGVLLVIVGLSTLR